MPVRYKVEINNSDHNEIFKLISDPDIEHDRRLCALLFPENQNDKDFSDYAYLITSDRAFFLNAKQPTILLPTSGNFSFKQGDIVYVNAVHQYFQFLFRVDGNANCLFTTDCCNSHCLMCPQPPKLENTIDLSQLRRIISCLPSDLSEICITGGEPTLLGSNLVTLLNDLATKCPNCHVHILTNARLFKSADYVNRVMTTGLKGLSFGVPLYSSDEVTHDYIVQTKGAFNETLEGIYNLARFNASVEIRVVLTKINALKLRELADFIYRNITFADHIAFMGMEHMGYVKLNWNKVYIDPKDYQSELFSAVRYLHLRGMNVSIYNHPLCILDRRIWGFSRNSITDFKKGYDQKCMECEVFDKCGGLFDRQKQAMPISPIKFNR